MRLDFQVVMRMQEDIATQITASHSSAKFPIDPNFKIKTRQLWQEILHSVGWKVSILFLYKMLKLKFMMSARILNLSFCHLLDTIILFFNLFTYLYLSTFLEIKLNLSIIFIMYGVQNKRNSRLNLASWTL